MAIIPFPPQGSTRSFDLPMTTIPLSLSTGVTRSVLVWYTYPLATLPPPLPTGVTRFVLVWYTYPVATLPPPLPTAAVTWIVFLPKQIHIRHVQQSTVHFFLKRSERTEHNFLICKKQCTILTPGSILKGLELRFERRIYIITKSNLGKY